MKIADIIVSANVAGLPDRFRRALGFVLRNECEYDAQGRIRWENTPGDLGGDTFAGLLRHGDNLPDDPTPSLIAQKYFTSYWLPFAGLPNPVQEVAFVQGVNQGIGQAVRQLQLACNDYGSHLTIDGRLGDATRKAAFGIPDSKELALAVLQKSRRRYEEIIDRNPSQEKFRNGWMARLEGIRTEIIG